MEILQGLAVASLEATPPRAASPKLTTPKFIESMDNMGAILEVFEATAQAAGWPNNHWVFYLRNSISGQGLLVVSSLSSLVQNDYPILKTMLLLTYHVSEKNTGRKSLTPYLARETLMHGSEIDTKPINNGYRQIRCLLKRYCY